MSKTFVFQAVCQKAQRYPNYFAIWFRTDCGKTCKATFNLGSEGEAMFRRLASAMAFPSNQIPASPLKVQNPKGWSLLGGQTMAGRKLSVRLSNHDKLVDKKTGEYVVLSVLESGADSAKRMSAGEVWVANEDQRDYCGWENQKAADECMNSGKRDKNGCIVEDEDAYFYDHAERGKQYGTGAFDFIAGARCVKRYRAMRHGNDGKLAPLQVLMLTKVVVASRLKKDGLSLDEIADVTDANGAPHVSGFALFMEEQKALTKSGDLFHEAGMAEDIITARIDDTRLGRTIAKLWGQVSHA